MNWDLSQDFDHQSDECIKFLYQLLVNEKYRVTPMLSQQQLEAIKKACIAANERILDLKFGCDIYDLRNRNIWKFLSAEEVYCNVYGEFGIGFIKKEEFEIIGRPIQLPDVLIAIGTQRIRLQLLGGSEISFEMLEESNVFTHEQSWKSTGISWNLLLPLDGQPEATINFLYELLL